MQIDGQTDMTKLIVTFHNFVKAPEKANFFLEQANKTHRGNRGIALLFL